MTKKEKDKIWEIKGASCLACLGSPGADAVKDRKAIQKIFRSEMVKCLEKRGFYTYKKEWDIHLRSDVSHQASISISITRVRLNISRDPKVLHYLAPKAYLLYHSDAQNLLK